MTTPPPQSQPTWLPPRPRKSTSPWIIVGIVAAIILVCCGFAGTIALVSNDDNAPDTHRETAGPQLDQATAGPSLVVQTTPQPQATARAVTLEIAGEGTAGVTYNTDVTGSSAQENGVSLPWKKEFAVPVRYAFLSVIAQHDSGGGPLTCHITVDGKEVKTATSTGQFTVVTCAMSG